MYYYCLAIVISYLLTSSQGFCPLTTVATTKRSASRPLAPVAPRPPTTTSTTTQLQLLLDVPDGFFTVTFPMLGILLSLSKNFARIRMEENAWEQRLAQGRKAQLRADPTLTELDLRRQEAAMEWSAYGKPRFEQVEAERQRRRVKVMERQRQEYDNDDDDEYLDDDDDDAVNWRREVDPEQSRMTDAEIQAFELEYGVAYDPYYDEPYTEEELPQDVKYQTDRRYGDRIYENGEIFYRHEGLYYRQGAKPRNLKFWQ